MTGPAASSANQTAAAQDDRARPQGQPRPTTRLQVLLHWVLFTGGTAALIGIGALLQH